MAQPQALKSAYGQNPSGLSEAKAAASDEFTEPLDASDDEFTEPLDASDYENADIIPPDTAIPGTARGLPEQQPDQGIAAQQGGFVGPYSPEYYSGREQLLPSQRLANQDIIIGAPPQYAGAMGSIEPQTFYSAEDLTKLLGAFQVGADIAIGAAFPAASALRIATLSGLTSYVFDTLKNQVNTDANQISTPNKIFNSVFGAVIGGASQKASQLLLGNVVKEASKRGDEAVLSVSKDLMEKEYGKESVQAVLSQAEKIGAQLTPAEAFPFDPAAQAVTAEAMKEYPKLGIQLANRIGQYKSAIRGLFGNSEAMPGAGNLRDFADEAISSYQRQMGTIQKQLNQAGSNVDVRLEGNELLDALKGQMEKVNVRLDGDVLAGDRSVVPRMSTLMETLKNKIVAKNADDFLKGEGQVTELGGLMGARTPTANSAENIAKLTLNDIESVRSEISDLVGSAYKKESKNIALTEDERIAKALYGDVARIRDSMNERVANAIGRPELAAEVKTLRTQYTNKIDALESIRNKLSKEPADQLKYLFNKNNAEEAGKVMSVLSPEQKVGLKSEFISRLIDPVTLREMGVEAGDKTLGSALNQLKSYDAGVLKQIYTEQELKAITTFLEMGNRAEKVLSKSGVAPEKVGIAKKFTQMLMDPKNSIVKPFLEKMDDKSALKQFADYKLFLAGQRAAGEISPAVANKLGAKPAGEIESIRSRLQQMPAAVGAARAMTPSPRREANE